MADDVVTLNFNNDLFTDARRETGRYTGSITVDYTTGTYSGRVDAKGAGFSASVGLSGHIGVNNGSYSINQGNFIVGWSGEQPTTASVEFVLNNNQDFRTSLNPPGQRDQLVTSSASGGGGTMAGGGSSGGGSTGTGSPPAGGTGSGGTTTGDKVVTLNFNDDLFTDARRETGRYTGSITVDYTTGTYSGRVNTKGAGFSASVGLSGHIGVNNGSYSINQGNFIVGWSGQQPTTASVEFVLNNNQDFRTSLNPPGQRDQSVMSSGGSATDRSAVSADSSSTSSSGGGTSLLGGLTNLFASGGEPSTAFIFDPGHGHGVVGQFMAAGAAHDTLSLPMADFGNSIAEVLRNTYNAAGGAVIADPATGDTVRLLGVSKGQLAHNRGDFAFHG